MEVLPRTYITRPSGKEIKPKQLRPAHTPPFYSPSTLQMFIEWALSVAFAIEPAEVTPKSL